jgi:hypothetical protein
MHDGSGSQIEREGVRSYPLYPGEFYAALGTQIVDKQTYGVPRVTDSP